MYCEAEKQKAKLVIKGDVKFEIGLVQAFQVFEFLHFKLLHFIEISFNHCLVYCW